MYRQDIKPIFDLVVASIIIAATLVLWLVIAVLIKLTSKGPVLFRQERTGYLGKNFYVYKFRSMPCDNDVHDATTENELTAIGKIIRTFSLDELPQLLNVISGKMSLIGPRPWIPEYYKRMNTEQRRRVIVRPGITGRAQVRGRNDLNIYEKLEEDLAYVDNISFKEDVKIIILTIRAIFRKTGVEIEKLGIHNELEQLLGHDLPHIRPAKRAVHEQQ